MIKPISFLFLTLSTACLIGCGGPKPDAEPESGPEAKPEAKADADSLYTRIGGDAAINAAVDLFYTKVLADEKVNDFFSDINMKKQHKMQKQFIAAALGGPEPYTGRSMKDAHKDLDLTEEDFGAIAGHLQATLTELKVDPAVIAEVMGAIGGLKGDVLGTSAEEAK